MIDLEYAQIIYQQHQSLGKEVGGRWHPTGHIESPTQIGEAGHVQFLGCEDFLYHTHPMETMEGKHLPSFPSGNDIINTLHWGGYKNLHNLDGVYHSKQELVLCYDGVWGYNVLPQTITEYKNLSRSQKKMTCRLLKTWYETNCVLFANNFIDRATFCQRVRKFDLEDFKSFIHKNPNFVDYVKSSCDDDWIDISALKETTGIIALGVDCVFIHWKNDEKIAKTMDG